MPKLGETTYYKTPAQGYYPGTRISRTFDYLTAPWAGNVPFGTTRIKREDFIKGVKEVQRYMPGYQQNLLKEAESLAGAGAPGYIAPGFEKYLPNAPTPSEEYFTPEWKAKAQKDWEEFQKTKIPAEIPSQALVSATAPEEPTREQKIADIAQQVQQIAQQVGGLQQRVATEGITGAGGRVLLPPTTPSPSGGGEGGTPSATGAPSATAALPATPPLENYTAQVSQSDTYQKFLEDYSKRQESLFGKISGILTGGKPKETPEEIVNRIMPEVPQRVKDIDLELGKLRTDYQNRMLQAEQQLAPMGFIRGSQNVIQRQYQIQKEGLLLEREALMGDYDRAQRRAEMILGLEKEQRQEERDNQRLAVQMLIQEATAEERLYLAGLERQLDRQDKLEDRQHEAQRQEQADITKTAISDPIAFAKYVAKYGYPKTADELLGRIGEFEAEPTKQQIVGSATTGYELVTYDEKGNIISRTPVKAGAKAEAKPEPLSILDVQRYKELYPDAGIEVGNTEEDANKKIYLTYTFPGIIQQLYDAGLSKETTETKVKKDNQMDIIPSEFQAVIDEIYAGEIEKTPQQEGLWDFFTKNFKAGLSNLKFW